MRIFVFCTTKTYGLSHIRALLNYNIHRICPRILHNNIDPVLYHSISQNTLSESLQDIALFHYFGNNPILIRHQLYSRFHHHTQVHCTSWQVITTGKLHLYKEQPKCDTLSFFFLISFDISSFRNNKTINWKQVSKSTYQDV